MNNFAKKGKMKMYELCEKIVKKLKEQNKTIAFMESCTGGFLANEITNISGASDILKVSIITYSNEYKIKFGINENTIKTYTVYSIETAKEMAKKISDFANSNIGVGITGELGNTINKEPKVYYTIYLKKENKYITEILTPISGERKKMKEEIAKKIFSNILEKI